jgi:hypothetical protein
MKPTPIVIASRYSQIGEHQTDLVEKSLNHKKSQLRSPRSDSPQSPSLSPTVPSGNVIYDSISESNHGPNGRSTSPDVGYHYERVNGFSSSRSRSESQSPARRVSHDQHQYHSNSSSPPSAHHGYISPSRPRNISPPTSPLDQKQCNKYGFFLDSQEAKNT